MPIEQQQNAASRRVGEGGEALEDVQAWGQPYHPYIRMKGDSSRPPSQAPIWCVSRPRPESSVVGRLWRRLAPSVSLHMGVGTQRRQTKTTFESVALAVRATASTGTAPGAATTYEVISHSRRGTRGDHPVARRHRRRAADVTHLQQGGHGYDVLRLHGFLRVCQWRLAEARDDSAVADERQQLQHA